MHHVCVKLAWYMTVTDCNARCRYPFIAIISPYFFKSHSNCPFHRHNWFILMLIFYVYFICPTSHRSSVIKMSSLSAVQRAYPSRSRHWPTVAILVTSHRCQVGPSSTLPSWWSSPSRPRCDTMTTDARRFDDTGTRGTVRSPAWLDIGFHMMLAGIVSGYRWI